MIFPHWCPKCRHLSPSLKQLLLPNYSSAWHLNGLVDDCCFVAHSKNRFRFYFRRCIVDFRACTASCVQVYHQIRRRESVHGCRHFWPIQCMPFPNIRLKSCGRSSVFLFFRLKTMLKNSHESVLMQADFSREMDPVR